MIQPMAAWLTGRAQKQPRAAWWGFGLGLIVLAVSTHGWLTVQAALLRGLALTGLAALLVAPPISATLSGAITALELRGETFQLLLLTPVRERLIVEGCIEAAVHRTRFIRALAAGMMPGLIVGVLAEYVRLFAPFYTYYPYNSYGGTTVSPPGIAVPGIIVSILVVIVWRLNPLAVRLGVAAALRWRDPVLAATGAGLMMLAFLLAPLFVMGSMALMALLCPVGAFLYFRAAQYLLGNRMIRDAQRWVRRGDV